MALTKGQKSAAEKNRLYWEQRELEQKKHYITDEKEYSKHLNKIYEDMRDNVQKEIEAFYGKYAKAEGISLSEAKKRVSQLDIEAYERKAKRYVEDKDFSKEANEEMRLYNATMKINRLEMLKANIGLELISGHEELQKYMESILQGRTEEELKRQAGILGETIKDNANAVHAIVNASFHNAKYSDRIWMHQDLLKSELSKQLQSGLIQGKNPRVLAKSIRQKFDVSKASAETLMRTELARVQTEAQKLSFERNGFEQYTFLALGDACGICKELNDKHFYVKDMMPGTNAPPMHPNCRCSTSAYEDSEEYDKWLEHLEKGGTTEEWEKLKNSSKNGKIKLGIDELTPCLRRMKDNKIVDTEVVKISPSKADFSDWEFDWMLPETMGYKVYGIKANGDNRIQGMIALKKDQTNYAMHVDVVEAAPFNNPHNKKYVKKEYNGVGGHLFAEAVKQSYKEGYGGAVYFTAKTNLIEHYQKELGAYVINPREGTMFIDEVAAKKLFDRYYGGNKNEN